MEIYISENGMRIFPVYSNCVSSILNMVFGINVVSASDIINAKEKMNETKKLLNNVLIKNTKMKIQLSSNTAMIVIIVETISIFKIVINIDLNDKNANCFNIEFLYSLF